MKIVVLNGSPKGNVSVTMQYVQYIQKIYPNHDLRILNISQQISGIEKGGLKFDEIIAEVRSAEGILWAFPLYFFLVPSQYKRFIELVFEKGALDAFRDKYAAVLTTSIHFFDHTAHNYMHAVSDDLGMRFAGSFSAEMDDLLDADKRRMLELFAGNFFNAIEKKQPVVPSYAPLKVRDFRYDPGNAITQCNLENRKMLLLTDYTDASSNLARMITRFKQSISGEVHEVNLRDLDMKGGCLGCIQCSFDNKCTYDGKDGYREFYDTYMRSADIIVMALTVVDRYFSSVFKRFLDRSFFNNHIPILIGKQFGYIISGPYSQISDLRDMFKMSVEFSRSNISGTVTDEFGDSAMIDSLLTDLAGRLVRDSLNGYTPPPTYLSVGGAKIFRDEIYGKMRSVFQADHEYYLKHRLYNFPQKNYKIRMLNAVLFPLLGITFIRKEFKKKINEGMIRPYQKVLKGLR